MLQRVDQGLAVLQNAFAHVYMGLSGARRAVRSYQAERHGWDRSDENFFKQPLRIERMADRMTLFESLCRGQRVLHVGCVDWPIFRPDTNLHLKLATLTQTLAGVDTNAAGIATLREHFDGRYYDKLADVDQSFDVVLVPEVIEHVPNAASFLEELEHIDFTQIAITAPNAIAGPPHSIWDGSYYRGDDLIEIVHPDHKCYYSPYTLKNVVSEFTPWRITRLGTIAKSAFVVATK